MKSESKRKLKDFYKFENLRFLLFVFVISYFSSRKNNILLVESKEIEQMRLLLV